MLYMTVAAAVASHYIAWVRAVMHTWVFVAQADYLTMRIVQNQHQLPAKFAMLISGISHWNGS